MKKTVISLLSMAFAATLFADTTFPMSVNFAQGAGDLNPALHGAHLIPPIKDHATQDDTDIKALGLYSVRNHDHALLDTNQRVFDLPLVYPLAQLDPTADASYIFPPTDELVDTVTTTIGTDLLYRLGVSTEESGEEHFNAEIPADFNNTAAAMSHIVARYKDKVTYWEIWNNPASTAYWWKDGYSDAQRKEAFVSFFTTALAKIKTDHPTVKAGGPSIMLPDTDGWIDAIIAGCKAASVKPDFISYQAVSTDIASIVASVATMRAKLDAAGWSDVELILTEWRHIPGENGIYQNLDAASMQGACFGTDGVMTISSALKNLSVMAGLQYAGGLSRAYFKMSMLRSPWSWANWSSNDSHSYNKSYYALKLFNEILAGGYTKLVSVQNEGSRTLLAAQNDAGTKGCVLLVDAAAASSGTYVLPMSGLKGVAKDGDVLALTASKNAVTASEVINVSDDKIQFFNYAGNCAYLVRFTMTPETPSDPTEDPTWTPPTGATFYEKLANDTRAVASSAFATGGDYIYQVSDTEYIHVFKDGGTFTPNQDLANVQVLVVGGGGSGGYGSGGGGGAGGLAYRTDASFASGTGYAVTVGAGGAKKTSSGSGNNGGISSIGDITAAGGGGGAGKNSAGVAGGSGGGGSGEGKGGGAGTTDLGSAGGAGGVASGYAIGGGGGGAGQPGYAAGTQGPSQEASIWNGGCGGDGLEQGSAILGYAQFFAGGGGGGTAGGIKRSGSGGPGGGGRGGYDLQTTTHEAYQTPGEDGLGGGGGGGAVDWDYHEKYGAAGGKGIVIVRYSAAPIHEHVWGEWFEEGGVEKRVCQYEGCDAFETREIPEPVTLTDYYKVGADPDDGVGHNSWVKSCSSTVGWALTQGGTVIADHQVSVNGRYIVPDGAVLRSPSNKDGTSGDPYVQQPFGGAELVLRTGGNLYLQSTGSGTTSDEQKSDLKGANLVKVPNLIAEGGTILHATASYRKRLEGAIEVRSAGLVVKQNNSGSNQERSLTIASTITGSGPIILASATVDSAAQYLRFTGDMSGFTGTFQVDSATAGHLKNEDFRITGAFGGTITALPEGFTSVEINYDGLDVEKGLRIASTTIPTALKTKLMLFGTTDFTAENLPLMTFPAGTTVNPAAFTVKYASTVEDTGVAFENLGTIENDDGSITLVANKPVPPPSVIEIPTGANFAYNGLSQTGVAAGTGYTLSGTFAATAVGNYTATATLDDPDTTKWTDGTTAAKTINWSITKATNGWKTEPSLSKTSWPVNQAPATLNVGAAAFGTMTATLNDAPFDLVNPVFPTEEGEYTLVITVAGSNDYDELVKEIIFTITEAVDSATYYLVGQDDGGASSFFSSSNPGTVGWAETEDGAAITHTVAVGNNYVIPAGTVMRTAPNDDTDTFLGDTLKLAGEIWFKKAGNTASPVKVLSIPKLIADGGTLNNEKNDINAFEIQGGLEIPEGKTLTVLNQGDTTTSRVRNFKISSTTTGSGTLFVSLGGGSTSGTSSKLELSGDWSEFTGQIAAASGKTKLASWTFIISGAFGGAIGEMPDRSSNPNYIINLADNPDGIRIAGTGDALPTCLRYRTCFYGADFANGTDINLLRVPKSVRAALTSKLEFKWAGSYADAIKGMQTGSPSPTAIGESKISFVDNRDGTETYVYNRTTFYEKLANDKRAVDASDYATGGDYIYQVSEKEYIHVFKNSGTFTPNKDLTDVQVLVVGGGGSGGYGSGGGGGAGGLVYQTDVSFTSGTGYTVTVGAGGAKKTSSGSGNNGDSSSIGDITAAGGGGGAGKNSAGVTGGSGGGGSGDGKSGGSGTADLGSAGGVGGVADGHPIGGGGGGAGQPGYAAGTQGPTQEASSWNGGCGGDGLEKGSAILGYEQFFAGGGGGGTAGGVKRPGIGGFGGGGRGGYDLNNATYQTPGEDGLGGGGGGGAVDWGSTDGKDHNGAAGGKGVVIVRYMVLVDAKITGTITMSGWKEDETPSEPDLTGLTVTPDMAASALLVKYYADADCTQALDGKPILAGTYYVRAEIEKTRQYTAAVSATTEFAIESGEKTVVPIPEVQSFVYDGNPKICVEAGDGYTIHESSIVTATDAGNYSVTLKLVDPETSQWSDLTSADKVIPWSIAQAENEWTTEAAIDKTEWMKTLDAPGVLMTPVAKFGTLVATLNGEPWDGTMPTEIASYTAKWTVEATSNYTGLEVTLAFRIKPDFHTNSWKTEPTISKTSWKSTEEPATIVPAEAAYGNETMTAKISVDNGEFVDWDGNVPTTKGAYRIQWVIEETESYSRLEKEIEFLIDRRYRPTKPFMVSTDNGVTWSGKSTIDDACKAASNGSIIIEVCEDVSISSLSSQFSYKTVTIRSNLDEEHPYSVTVDKDKDKDEKFYVYNSGKLVLTNICFNLPSDAKIQRLVVLGNWGNAMSGSLEIKAGTVISGEVTESLVTSENSATHMIVSGGVVRNLMAEKAIFYTPSDETFTIKGLTIENSTVKNGALLPIGNKTLNLSNVTITNNTTTAGAITVGESGKLNVSGDVIVTGNTAGGVAKNVVPTNEANIELAGALGASAIIGVSYGTDENDQFGLASEGGDDASASRFVNDAYTTLIGKIADGKLVWVTDVLQLIIAGDENTPLTNDREKLQEFLFEYDVAGYAEGKEPSAEAISKALAEVPTGDGVNGLPLWKDYALGIAPTTSVKAVADAAHDTDETAITVKIPTLKDKTGSGDFTIRYQVVDRATKVEKSTTTDPSAIKIPLATGIYDIKIVFTPAT